MATINLGRIKPVFKGAYAGGTAYVVDDIVTSGNETFICILASTGNATSNATYWTKLASKGADGTDGTDLSTTLTTQGDILYRDGSGLQRLGAGTSGQVLTTGGTGANPSWATASGGGGSSLAYFSVYRGDQSGGSANTYSKFTGATVITDTANAYDSTNYEYVIPTTGSYLLGASFRFYDNSSTGDFHDVSIQFDWDQPSGYNTLGGSYNQDNYSGGGNITAGSNYHWFTSILPNRFIAGQRVYVSWKYDCSGYYGLWSNSPGTTNRFWILQTS